MRLKLRFDLSCISHALLNLLSDDRELSRGLFKRVLATELFQQSEFARQGLS